MVERANLGRKPHPQFRPVADTLPEVKPVEQAPPKVEETPQERRKRQNANSSAAYLEKMAPVHGRINKALEDQGKAPLSVVHYDKPAPVSTPVSLEGRPAPEPLVPDIAAQENPNLPKFSFKAVEKLPSKAIPYPKGATVKYRSYTFGELEELANSTISIEDRFLFVLRGVETNFETLSLTVPDVLLVGLLRKVFTIGSEEFTVSSPCPACGKVHTLRFYTAQQEGIDPESVLDFNYLNVPALPLRVDFTFGTHIFYPLTISDYLYLLDQDFVVNRITRIAIQCHSLDFPESIDIFANVTDPGDIAKLKKINKILDHHVKPLHVECDNILDDGEGGLMKCGEHVWVDLTNSVQSIILPFHSEDDTIDHAFHFGEDLRLES
jgi:hypothetical protein